MNRKTGMALLGACALAAFASAGHSVVIEKDTEVLVTVLDRLTPKTVKSGDIILFSVAAPVKNAARQVIIEQSADAWGTIVRVPPTKALSTDELSWDIWTRPDRRGQLEREKKLREKKQSAAERREKKRRGKNGTSEDEYPITTDKNWGTLGITIDRAVTVNSKDVMLIADVANEDSHTMITKTRHASFDLAEHNMTLNQQLDRSGAVVAAHTDASGDVAGVTSPDKTTSRDVTLAIPWNVFTTGTLSVVEPGTVLRARVLETTLISDDPKPEIKKPVPVPPKPRVRRKPRPKKPGPKCPCCFYCTCKRGSDCACHNKSLPLHPAVPLGQDAPKVPEASKELEKTVVINTSAPNANVQKAPEAPKTPEASKAPQTPIVIHHPAPKV